MRSRPFALAIAGGVSRIGLNLETAAPVLAQKS